MGNEVVFIMCFALVGLFAYIFWTSVNSADSRKKTLDEFRTRPLHSILACLMVLTMSGTAIWIGTNGLWLSGWFGIACLSIGLLWFIVGVIQGDIILFGKKR